MSAPVLQTAVMLDSPEAQVRAAHVRFGEVGAREVRLVEVCTVKVGARELGAGELRVVQIRPVQVGAGEIDAGEIAPLEVGAGEIAFLAGAALPGDEVSARIGAERMSTSVTFGRLKVSKYSVSRQMRLVPIG